MARYRTYAKVWRIKRSLRHIFGIDLGFSISLPMFFGVLFTFVGMVYLSQNWTWFSTFFPAGFRYVFVPGMVGLLLGLVEFEGRAPWEYVYSALRSTFQPERRVSGKPVPKHPQRKRNYRLTKIEQIEEGRT